MKILKIQYLNFIPVFLMLLSQSAYSIDLFEKDKKDVIYEVGANVYVKLESQDDTSTGKNDHPVNLNEETINKALSFLTMQGENVLDSNSVFTVGEINILSKNLVRALSQAKSDQDVIFAVRKTKDRVLGLKDNQYYDAGRVFYKSGKLNLIMGDYDRPKLEGYEQAYDPTNMGITRYHFNHGIRDKALGRLKFNTGGDSDGVEASTYAKNKRLDWVEITLDSAASAFDNELRDAKRSELASRREELRELFGDDLGVGLSEKDRIRLQKESRERRKMREEMARMRQQMKEGGSTSSSSMSPEQRLTRLKKLKDQGLISNEEYVVKRKEILRDL